MKDKNPNAVALGAMTSEKKAASSKENGKKGGRPHRHKWKLGILGEAGIKTCKCGLNKL